MEDLTRHEHSICTLHHYPERTELYKAGLTDSEIAERLGLTTGCVASWRQKRRLPANAKQGPPRESFPERMELYRAGLTDREIADKLHLPIATVCSWRMSRDLPPNGFEEKKSNIEQRMELYLAGYTDIEIATALNLNRSHGMQLAAEPSSPAKRKRTVTMQLRIHKRTLYALAEKLQ